MVMWMFMHVGVHGAATFESWNTYVNALSARFGKQVYDDPIAELRNLRQTILKQVLLKHIL